MEYLLNWLVLLVLLGGIVVVAVVCCADLMRRPARVQPAAAPAADMPPEPEDDSTDTGAKVELTYRLGDEVRQTQTVSAKEPGCIGGISCDMGPGVPLRHVRVFRQDGAFYCVNEDWQAPARLRTASGEEIELVEGQAVQLEDGAELHLLDGWVVDCRIAEGGDR